MAQSNLTAMNKFPSVSSIHSMVSMGYLPPGHGYIPKKIKPDKPYGPSYITTMNRTWRGPGRQCLKYALVAFCLAILFYISGALYFAHRNVSRLIVRHSEPLGACLLIVAILLTTATFYFIYEARMASNRWRSFVRFQADGLFHVAPTNDEYSPRDPTKLTTGTYGPRAVKEIPKPRYMKKSQPGSRAGGRKRGAPMTTLMEGDEELLAEEDEMAMEEMVDGPQRFKAEMPEVHKPSPMRLGQPIPELIHPQAPQVEKIVPLEKMPTHMRATPELRMPPQARMAPEPRMPPGMERMPPNMMRQAPEYRMHPGMERMPPPMHPTHEARPPPGMERMSPAMRQTPEPRMPPGYDRMRQTPEPMPPGVERMPAGARSTPEPRMIPGSGRQQPPERMPAGRLPPAPERMVPGSMAPTPARMAPGSLPPAPPRMVPGTRQTPEPRMVPGQGRTTAPAPSRMVPGSQSRP